MRKVILSCLFFAHGVGFLFASEQAPATTAKSTTQSLTWPEIRDPQSLIEFVQERFGVKQKPSDSHQGYSNAGDDPRVRYLEPQDFYAREQFFVLIFLSTHPFKGQAIMVILDPKQFVMPQWVELIGDTANPQIKRVLVRLPPGRDWFFGEAGVSVRMTSFSLKAAERSTAPVPLSIPLPDFPVEMLKVGVRGEARLEFTVNPDGTVTDIDVKGTTDEFAQAVRNAAPRWRFEPGVDRVSRLPTSNLLGLTVKFGIEDE